MKSGDLKRKSGMVRVLGGFSEQQNIKKHHPILQVDDFDDGSRIQISNELYKLLGIVFGNRAGYFFGPNFSYNLTDILCKDNIEWRAIKELINTGKGKRICLLAVDGVDIASMDGLYKYQDLSKRVDNMKPSEIAAFLEEYCEVNQLLQNY